MWNLRNKKKENDHGERVWKQLFQIKDKRCKRRLNCLGPTTNTNNTTSPSGHFVRARRPSATLRLLWRAILQAAEGSRATWTAERAAGSYFGFGWFQQIIQLLRCRCGMLPCHDKLLTFHLPFEFTDVFYYNTVEGGMVVLAGAGWGDVTCRWRAATYYLGLKLKTVWSNEELLIPLG